MLFASSSLVAFSADRSPRSTGPRVISRQPGRPTESAVRYVVKRRPPLWPAAVISLGVHALVLLGLNDAGRIETTAQVYLEADNMHLFDVPEDYTPPKPADRETTEEEASPTNPQDLAAASLPEPAASMDINSVIMEIGPPPPPVAPRVDSLASFSIPTTQSRSIGNGAGKMLDVFDLSELDKKPQVLVQSAPSYPFELKHQGITGEVVLRFIVDRHGVVHDPALVAASHPRFADPALAAILRWKFKPGQKAGRAVNTRMEITMRFKLDDRS